MSLDEEDLPSFGELQITKNSDGWGPSDIPEGFKDMPYQPFSKDTRLGKVADWCGTLYPDIKSKNRYTSQYGGGAQYAYYHDEDDSSFQLATGGKDLKGSSFRQRFRFPFRGRRGGPFTPGYSNRGGNSAGSGGGQFMSLGNFGGRQRRYPMNERERLVMQQQQQQQRRYGGNQPWQGNRRGGVGGWQDGQGGNWRQNPGDYNRRMNRSAKGASVTVQDSWVLVDDFDFTQLMTLSLPSVKEPTTIFECGSVKPYDKSYDSINTRTEKPLVRFVGVVHAVTTTEDPIIQRLARESGANVYCTDRIAAALMCSPKSVDSWDILAVRVADKLFFDVRPSSTFDLVTVAETAAEPPYEEAGHINCSEKLALEATFINLNFPQQVVVQNDQKPFAFPNPNPFTDEEDEEVKDDVEKVASIGYRYRMFDLGAGIQCVIRCEVDAVLPAHEQNFEDSKTSARFASIKALNEFDYRYCNGINWRSKLDAQRGAVIASELKNNSCKLHKWTTGAIMSGADRLKLGFVSRVNPKDTSHHVILGVQDFRPSDFAQQINLNMDNGWGILRCIIDYFLKCEPGQYLVLKDPTKSTLHIYSLPSNAFASESESNSSDEEADAKKRS